MRAGFPSRTPSQTLVERVLLVRPGQFCRDPAVGYRHNPPELGERVSYRWHFPRYCLGFPTLLRVQPLVQNSRSATRMTFLAPTRRACCHVAGDRTTAIAQRHHKCHGSGAAPWCCYDTGRRAGRRCRKCRRRSPRRHESRSPDDQRNANRRSPHYTGPNVPPVLVD
jgi:hypothetical protein